jgi:hypothetical protein
MPKASLFHLAGQVCECGFSGTCLRHPPSAYNSFALLDKFDTLNIRKGLDMDTIQDDSADGTGLGLVQFLTYAGARGYVKQGPIAGMKSACIKILQVTQGENWKTKSVMDLDLEEINKRFANLMRGSKIGVASVKVYIARFRNSIDMYKRYLEDPLATPSLPTGTRTSTSSSEPRLTANTKAQRKGVSKPVPPLQNSTSQREIPDAHDHQTVRYPFPLREGLIVSLNLPADLTPREAKRLGTFIESLAVDDAGSSSFTSAVKF